MSEKLKIAIVADVHGNLLALETVLAKLKSRGYDYLWFLGDIVNYGPWPSECVDLLREKADVMLAGNHDYLVCGKHPRAQYQEKALQILDWTIEQLGQERLRFLCSLTAGKYLRVPDFAPVVPQLDSKTVGLKWKAYWFAQKSPLLHWKTFLMAKRLLTQPPVIRLVHGSPRDPISEYMFTDGEFARENLMRTLTGMLLFAHTHVPMVTKLVDGEITTMALKQGEPVVFNPYDNNSRVMLNPGSIGQPRDGNPAASYATLTIKGDPTSPESKWIFTNGRIAYDVDSVVKQYAVHSLPNANGLRLHVGG